MILADAAIGQGGLFVLIIVAVVIPTITIVVILVSLAFVRICLNRSPNAKPEIVSDEPRDLWGNPLDSRELK